MIISSKWIILKELYIIRCFALLHIRKNGVDPILDRLALDISRDINKCLTDEPDIDILGLECEMAEIKLILF